MLTYLKNLKIKESSGLCRSLRHLGVYFTHNDSGNKSTIYGFNEQGDDLCEFNLNVLLKDAEDISSNLVNNIPTIILGDVGDNLVNRTSYAIHVIVEPEALITQSVKSSIIKFKYPDGISHNCESICLRDDGVIILVTKNYPSGTSAVYELRSFLSGDVDGEPSCKFITTIPRILGTMTSMDLSPTGTTYALLGNGKAYFYNNNGLFTKPIRTIICPKSYQPEGLCFTQSGLDLLMSCEVQKTATIQQTPIYTINI